MSRPILLLLGLCLCADIVQAADSSGVERKFRKEPVYGAQPYYGLLTFGPNGVEPVWLVWVDDTLYVDRNGNGDLTEAAEKVTAKKRPLGAVDDKSYTFDVGELHIGVRTHKGLRVDAAFLGDFAGGSLGSRDDVKAALTKDPKATVFTVALDVETPALKGGGAGGRCSFIAGPVDLGGVLQFSNKAADAPVVQLGEQLQITFYGERPTVRVGRDSKFDLVVGIPGTGPGTFAMLAYDDTIPGTAHPVAEITFPAAKADSPPLMEMFELKERC